SQFERRVRQLEHEPRLADALHPRADERDDLAGPEQAVVAVTERPQSGPWHGSWPPRVIIAQGPDILAGTSMSARAVLLLLPAFAILASAALEQPVQSAPPMRALVGELL